MMRTVAVTVAAMAVLSACQSAAKLEEERAPLSPHVEIDPFTLAIEAGRWSVLIDRARDGVMQSPPAVNEEELTLRIDETLKTGALTLLVLRNEACRKGLALDAACSFDDWPAWTLEPPVAGTDLETLRLRSEWLGEAQGELTYVGCEVGREVTGEDFFCAVE